MLRLERQTCKGQDITIRIAENEPLFNRRFLRAFVLAAGLHLVALGFVRLESVPAEPSLPQATVIAELAPTTGAVQPELAEVPLDRGSGLLPHYMLLPESKQPDLPTPTFQKVDFQERTSKELESPETSFREVEVLRFRPDPFAMTFITEYSPVSCQVQGALAAREVLNTGLGALAEYQERFEPITSYSVTYMVHVENHTGEPFAVELGRSSGNKELDTLARQVVRSMKFRPTTRGFVTRGVVELHFELNDALPLDTLAKLQRRPATS